MNYLCNIFTKDREIAAAVNENGKAFYYVNESIKDEALALAAVTQNEMALQHINDEFTTAEVIFAALRQNGYSLKFTRNSKSSKICVGFN